MLLIYPRSPISIKPNTYLLVLIITLSIITQVALKILKPFKSIGKSDFIDNGNRILSPMWFQQSTENPRNVYIFNSERNSDMPMWRKTQGNQFRYRNRKQNFDPALRHDKDYETYDTYPTTYWEQQPETALLPTTMPPPEAPAHESLLSQLKTLWQFHQACMTIWNAIVDYKQKLAPEIKTVTNITTSAMQPARKNTTKVHTKRDIQSKAISVARYIKNDPLKSYYDFVIVEASHKFWSVFEVITSVIIIYSTFAAIYFSKMNPLVSKHDYHDYLGSEDYMGPPEIKIKTEEGARDIDADDVDIDFIDIDAADDVDDEQHATYWFDWLPKTSHSVKFILDAVNKIPVMDQG